MQEAITGYRGHLKKLGTLPISVKVSLSIFDDYLRHAYTNEYLANAKGLDECPEFDPENGGNTALRDCILEDIAHHEQLLAGLRPMRDGGEHAGPPDVLMAILTDGHDTHSKATPEQVAEKIAQKRREGWEFIFIGPSRGVGESYGVAEENIKELGKGGEGIAEAFAEITEGTSRLLLGTGSRA